MFTARAASSPNTVSAVSSWQRAREHCRKEVQDSQNDRFNVFKVKSVWSISRLLSGRNWEEIIERCQGAHGIFCFWFVRFCSAETKRHSGVSSQTLRRQWREVRGHHIWPQCGWEFCASVSENVERLNWCYVLLCCWDIALCCRLYQFLAFFRAIFCRLPTCDRPFDPDLDGWCTCPSLFLLPFAHFAYFPWFHWLCILLQHLWWGLEPECWTRKEWNNKTRKQNQKKWSTKWKVPATHGDSCDSCDMLLPGICDTSRWCMWTRRSQAMTAQPASQETVGCEQRRRGSQGSH